MGWVTIPDDSSIMELVPRAEVTHDVAKRLREIDPYLVAKFNVKRQIFEIWRELPNHPPHLLMDVRNRFWSKEFGAWVFNKHDMSFAPIDNRTFSTLRYIVWYNQDIRRNLRKSVDADNERKALAEQREHNEYYYRGLQDYRVFQMASRELGYTSGKAKISTIQAGIDL